MSRSKKHTPIVKDNTKGRRLAKRMANKRVRKYKKELSDGRAYRKVYNRYDIYDLEIFCPYERWAKKDEPKDGRDKYEWEKIYLNK